MLRQPIIYGELPEFKICALAASVTIFAVIAAVITLMRYERRIIFYL